MKHARFASALRGMVLVLAAWCLAGCGVLQGIRKPTARIVDVRLRDISLTSLTLVFDLQIGNPYSVPLPLANVDYGLASEGKQFLSGNADIQGTVPPRGGKTVSLPAKLEYWSLLSVLKKVRPGSVVPYEAELGLSVDPPVGGRLRLPLRKQGRLPVPAPPSVRITEIAWDQMSLSHAGGRARLQLTNRNRFPVTLSKLTYGLSLGGVEVARSSLAAPVFFKGGGGEGMLEIPISVSPKNLGLAAFRMLTGKGAGYRFHGAMDANTDFGPMALPIEGIGKTIFKRLRG